MSTVYRIKTAKAEVPFRRAGQHDCDNCITFEAIFYMMYISSWLSALNLLPCFVLILYLLTTGVWSIITMNLHRLYVNS